MNVLGRENGKAHVGVCSYFVPATQATAMIRPVSAAMAGCGANTAVHVFHLVAVLLAVVLLGDVLFPSGSAKLLKRCFQDLTREMSGETFPHFGTAALHVGQEPEQWDMNQVLPSFMPFAGYP